MPNIFTYIFNTLFTESVKSANNAINNDKSSGLPCKVWSEDLHTSICKAPFTNMYFDVTGKVHACCLSWKCSEEISNKTIQQVWEGEKFNSLREHIRMNDLAFACDICNSQIKNKDFNLALINMFDNFTDFDREHPKMMEFELSNICNLECIMCNRNFSSSIRKNRDHLPPAGSFYDESFMEQVEKYIPYLEKARFIGGEPFLVEIYFNIWEKIIEINPGITISVGTNGTILNSRIKELLKKGRFEIVFSLDSINKSVYESIRKNADFIKVMENLDFFYNYCQKTHTFFDIAVCPMQQNWNELPDIIRFCNNKNISVFFNTVIEPFECALWALPGDKLAEISDYLANANLTGSVETVKNSNYLRYSELVNQINKWKEKSREREKALISKSQSQLKDEKDKFIKNLTNFIDNSGKTDPKERDLKVEYFLSRTGEIIDLLPQYINKCYLFSILNTIDVSLIVDNLVNMDNNELITEARSLITNHFYNFGI